MRRTIGNPPAVTQAAMVSWRMSAANGLAPLPRPDEAAEFAELWGRFKTVHAYGVDRMLHDLVATEAYGVP